MTTYVQARDTLVSEINTRLLADFPAVKVFYENTTQVDLNTVGDMFMLVSVDFLTAKQASVEYVPQRRTLGELTCRLMYKEGKGTRGALGFFDYLTTTFASKQFGGVTTRTPTPGKKQSKDGWAAFDLHVPFLFDSIG